MPNKDQNMLRVSPVATLKPVITSIGAFIGSGFGGIAKIVSNQIKQAVTYR
jgi:hypothetical protein